MLENSQTEYFWCPGSMGVGFGVPFFVSGLHKFMGKLADGIFWGPGSIWACLAVQLSLCLAANRIDFGVQGPRGLGLGFRFDKFIGKLADRIFFWLQGPFGFALRFHGLCVCPSKTVLDN